MKSFIRYIALTLCALSAMLASAQVNVPLIREGVEWGYVSKYRDWDYSNDCPAIHYLYFRYCFSGDTVVDGKTYKICWIYDSKEFDKATAEAFCLFRQDGGNFYTYFFSPNTYSKIVPYYFEVVPMEMSDFLCYTYDKYEKSITIPQGDMNLLADFAEQLNYVGDTIVGKDQKRAIFRNDSTGSRFIEGLGLVPTPARINYFGDSINIISDYYGIIPYPRPLMTSSMSHWCMSYLLYERDLATDELVYKSIYFDKYAAGDPTLSAVEKVGSDAPVLNVSERTVSAEGVVIEAYGIDGRLVAKGVGTLTLPDAGVYILRTPGQALMKVVVR